MLLILVLNIEYCLCKYIEYMPVVINARTNIPTDMPTRVFQVSTS